MTPSGRNPPLTPYQKVHVKSAYSQFGHESTVGTVRNGGRRIHRAPAKPLNLTSPWVTSSFERQNGDKTTMSSNGEYLAGKPNNDF